MTRDKLCIDPAQVRAEVAGNELALRWLVDVLAPVVQARVARTLLRHGAEGRGRLRQELEDFTQDVFVELFAHGGRALTGWDPAAGRSLQNYVGQRAEWFVASRLRTSALEAGPPAEPVPREPGQLEHRDSVRRLVDGIERRWPVYGTRLFFLLFVLQVPSKEVGAELGLTVDAVDQWRFRLREFARILLRKD